MDGPGAPCCASAAFTNEVPVQVELRPLVMDGSHWAADDVCVSPSAPADKQGVLAGEAAALPGADRWTVQAPLQGRHRFQPKSLLRGSLGGGREGRVLTVSERQGTLAGRARPAGQPFR
jgi:hypothetical protein